MNKPKFEEVFFDVSKHDAKPGQIAVCYSNSVELLDCPFKDELISVLQIDGAAGKAVNLLTRVGKATSLTAYSLCKQMIVDLLATDVKMVKEKAYKYLVQLYFYTSPEHFPHDDPHWSLICTISETENCYAKNI
jgi:hypothetical protein